MEHGGATEGTIVDQAHAEEPVCHGVEVIETRCGSPDESRHVTSASLPDTEGNGSMQAGPHLVCGGPGQSLCGSTFFLWIAMLFVTYWTILVLFKMCSNIANLQNTRPMDGSVLFANQPPCHLADYRIYFRSRTLALFAKSAIHNRHHVKVEVHRLSSFGIFTIRLRLQYRCENCGYISL